MDRKKALERSKNAVTLFFRIRRGFKIYTAFATGVLSAVALYRELYRFSGNRFYAVALAVLAGAFVTAMMLLILEIIRTCIRKGKTIGEKLLRKFTERRTDHEEKD
ncbi:MAG: hypothetical protein IJ060_07335 [Oscillospiraceae bacterium]|nr:hypothetical protein [Oscillospiraceae bacterium]